MQEHVQGIEAEEQESKTRQTYQGESCILARQLLAKWVASIRTPMFQYHESCAVLFDKEAPGQFGRQFST